MGCGKTTTGRLLAQRLGWPFADLDNWIAEKEGLTIPEIFERYGEAGFRDREHAAIRLAAKKKGLVLATGGGALTFDRNVCALNNTCRIVLLDPGFDICYGRISGDENRPLVMSNTRDSLHTLYQARTPLYRQAAHLSIESSDSPDEIISRILDGLEKSE